MINERIVRNFIQFLCEKLQDEFQQPALYSDSFIFEDADPPFSISEAHSLDKNREYIAYPTETIYKHPQFQDFMRKYNLITHNNTLLIKDAALLDNIKVSHFNLHMPFHKTVVTINGSLFNIPQRDYSLNFINDKEWVLHVYDSQSKTNKQLLYYFFSSIN